MPYVLTSEENVCMYLIALFIANPLWNHNIGPS